MLLIILATASPIQAKTELEFWTINLSPNYDNYFLEKIEEFEEKNPNLKIIWQDINFSSINQKLRYQIAAGKAPALVNLSPQLMAPLLKDDLLRPISDFQKDYSKNYYPLLWENGYYQGKYYAFPWYLSSKVMIFNQEILKIAGLNKTDLTQNKAALYKAAEKITAKTGIYALMPQIKIEQEFMEAGINLFEDPAKKQKAAFNNKKAESIIKRYQDLVQKKVIPKDSLTAGFNIALERYQKNELAILFSPQQFIKEIESESKYLKDISQAAVIPTAEKGLVNAALMNLVLPKNNPHPKEALKFATFISSHKSQSEFSRIAPVLASTKSTDLDSNLKQEKLLDTANNQISLTKKVQIILKKQLSRNQDLTLIHPKADKLLKVMETEFSRAFANKISAKEALNQMEKKWNKILAEETLND
ncbi:MAG: ABC transporter substrate-binding protein [Bacillota bacterium]